MGGNVSEVELAKEKGWMWVELDIGYARSPSPSLGSALKSRYTFDSEYGWLLGQEFLLVERLEKRLKWRRAYVGRVCFLACVSLEEDVLDGSVGA